MNRFVDSRTITVRPNDITPVTIGEAVMAEGDDTMWLKVTSSSSGDCPWPWSYALIHWESEQGRELGTVKVNGVCEGEVFRLGVGRPPLLRTGTLKFTPRSYNLAWVNLGNPWTITVSYASGKSSGSGGTRAGAVINSFVNTANNGLSLVRVNFP